MRHLVWPFSRKLAATLAMFYGTVVCPINFAAQSAGSWIHTAFFDNQRSVWVVKITSMVQKQMSCTVTWKGTKTGSTYYGDQNVGGPVSGSFTLQVPAYPGRGAAVVAQSGVDRKSVV